MQDKRPGISPLFLSQFEVDLPYASVKTDLLQFYSVLLPALSMQPCESFLRIKIKKDGQIRHKTTCSKAVSILHGFLRKAAASNLISKSGVGITFTDHINTLLKCRSDNKIDI